MAGVGTVVATMAATMVASTAASMIAAGVTTTGVGTAGVVMTTAVGATIGGVTTTTFTAVTSRVASAMAAVGTMAASGARPTAIYAYAWELRDSRRHRHGQGGGYRDDGYWDRDYSGYRDRDRAYRGW